MPRLKLVPRNTYPYSWPVAVRTTDLNYGGHLGNDTLLSLIQEARVAFLASRDWSELDCGGPGLIMGDAAVVYQGEGFAGDELRIEVAAGETARTGFRLFYRVTREVDAAAIALAETGMVCYDYGSKKVVALPEAVRSSLEGS